MQPQGLFFGKYEIVGSLREGGMGEVFLAVQHPLGRRVVLKTIRQAMLAVPDIVPMFLDEARVLSQISHPNVVRLYDFGQEPGLLFIVMEYLDGLSLSDMLQKLRAAGRGLPPDLAVALALQACAGLHAVHELRDEAGQPRGVVHRDISPHNLICMPDGAVKLIDFGIALARDRVVQKTRPGMLKGKLAYMSPEQARSASVDRRSDVFSMATVLVELLTGEPLFLRANDAATCMAVIAAQVPPLRQWCDDIAEALECAIRRALAQDPATRTPTAARFAEELAAALRQAGHALLQPGELAAQLERLGVVLASSQPWPSAAAPPPFALACQTVTAAPSAAILDAVEVGVPPPGQVEAATTAHGTRVVLRSIEIDTRRTHRPVLLPMSAVPNLLPAPLLVTPRNESLAIEVGQQDEVPGGPRPSLYDDAAIPDTRHGNYLLIKAEALGLRFDVGHRKAKVQHLAYSSTLDQGAGQPLRVGVPAVGLSVKARPGRRQLAVIATQDRRTGEFHLDCVAVL